MSNRFSTWSPTSYVPLPVENYQQALMQNDQEAQSQVDQAKQAMYQFRSLTPTGADARAAYDQTMDSLMQDIQAVSKSDFKTHDALTRINDITSNPEYLGKFRGIFRDTENAIKMQNAYSEHLKKFGNDVNAQPILAAMMNLKKETGDASKFNPNRFDNMSAIPDYVEVQPEIDKVIKEMKANKGYMDDESGKFIRVEDWEKLGADDIRKAVKSQLGARKDLTTQLNRNIKYDYFMKNPGDVQGAMNEEGAAMIDNFRTGYQQTKQILALAATDKKKLQSTYRLRDDQVDQFVQDQKTNLDQLGRYVAAADNAEDPTALYQNMINEKYLDRHANASASVFSHYAKKLDIKVEPYKLAKYQSDLAMGRIKYGKDLDLDNWKKKHMFELQKFKDGTSEVQLGTGGDTDSTLSGPAQEKLKNGLWIADLVPLYESTKNFTGSSNNDVLITGKAKELGWNGTGQALDYLENAWKTQSQHASGYINPAMDQNFIVESIVGSPGGLTFYKDGVKATEDQKKKALTLLKNYRTDDNTKDLNAIAKFPITIARDGKVGIMVTDPEKSSEQTFIELPKGMQQKFGAAGTIQSLERDLNFKGTQNIDTHVGKYTLTREPGSNSIGLYGYKDANDVPLIIKGEQEIQKVARQMLRNQGINVADNYKVFDQKAVASAINAINTEYQYRLQTDRPDSNDGDRPFTVNGVKLDMPAFRVLNSDDLMDPYKKNTVNSIGQLRIGMSKPYMLNGKPRGLRVDGKFLQDEIMREGIGQLPSNKPFKDVNQNSTSKEKESFEESESMLNSIYNY